jgi:hypothetical protein
VILATGTARTSLVPGGGIVGTASADRSGATDYLVTGTADCDYSVVGPWLARGTRRTRVRVVLDGEQLTGLTDTVTIEESDDAITRIATFSVLDPRAAFWNPASITRGKRTVQIYARADDYTSRSEELVFTGITDTAPNEGAYRPKATFRCLSLAGALLTTTNGCVHVPAFAGLRRRDILIAYALSSGITLTLPDGIFETIVTKAVDISGISIEALILRYCDVEDLYCRELPDGSLEFLTWADVTGPSYLDVDGKMFIGSPREDPPNRPVTLISVGGTTLSITTTAVQSPVTTIEQDDKSYDVDGITVIARRRLTVTRLYGAEIQSVLEDWKIYARLGVSTNAATYQLVSRVTTTTDYVMAQVQTPLGNLIGYDPVAHASYNYLLAPTAQVSKVTTVTEGWFSPLDMGGSLWTDGTHHSHTVEQFLETARAITTNAYASPDDPSPCRLLSQVVTTQGWYVQKTTVGSPVLFDDGTYRAAAAQTYREVSKVTDAYADNLAAVEAGATGTRVNVHTKTTTAWGTTGWGTIAAVQYPIETYGITNVKTERQSGIVGAGTFTLTQTETVIGKGSETIVSLQTGSIADPQVASATSAQFTYVPMESKINAWTDLFPVISATATNEDAENQMELDRVTKRMARRNLAVTETFNMRAVLAFRALHPMALTDPTRSLDTSKRGHVQKLTRDFSTLNGWLGMQVTMAIDPEGFA